MDSDELEPGVYTNQKSDTHTVVTIVPEKKIAVDEPQERSGQSRLDDDWGESDAE